MNVIETAAIAFVAGLAGAMLVDLRFWVGFAADVRRHGLDNHLCRKAGCCR